MAFSISNFFSGEEDNKIVHVEEDTDVDNLENLKDAGFFGENKPKEADASEAIGDKEGRIKSLLETSNLTREKIDEFYPKMKSANGSAKRMIESVLEMMSDEERKDKKAETIITNLGKKLSPESLAKISAAMIILIEEDQIDSVLGISENEPILSGGSLSEKLKSAGIDSSKMG